jgi:hypothetical protein
MVNRITNYNSWQEAKKTSAQVFAHETWCSNVRCYPRFDYTLGYQLHAASVRFLIVVDRKIETISSVKLEVDITWAAAVIVMDQSMERDSKGMRAASWTNN